MATTKTASKKYIRPASTKLQKIKDETSTVVIADDMSQVLVQEDSIQQIECKLMFLKTHPDAKLPTQSHIGDNCWDLYAVEDVEIPPTQGISRNGVVSSVNIGSAIVPVGLQVAYITPGFGFALKPRSGLGFKFGIYPHAGEIDNAYRGDCAVKLYNFTNTPYHVTKGDRICQLKVEKNYTTVVSFSDKIDDTVRGTGGLGSSGK